MGKPSHAGVVHRLDPSPPPLPAVTPCGPPPTGDDQYCDGEAEMQHTTTPLRRREPPRAEASLRPLQHQAASDRWPRSRTPRTWAKRSVSPGKGNAAPAPSRLERPQTPRRATPQRLRQGPGGPSLTARSWSTRLRCGPSRSNVPVSACPPPTASRDPPPPASSAAPGAAPWRRSSPASKPIALALQEPPGARR